MKSERQKEEDRLDMANMYTHEEMEEEYYARKSSGGLPGCLMMMVFLALATIGLLIKNIF